MCCGGGSKQPQPTSTQVVEQTKEFPAEIKPYITDILGKSQALFGQQTGEGYQVFPGGVEGRIAPLESEQLEALEGYKDLGRQGIAGTSLASARPYFESGLAALGGSMGAFGPEQAQQYMNPYQQAVVDIAKREAERSYIPVFQGIGDVFEKSGGFGGSRQAVREAEASRTLQQQKQDIQTRGMQQAFEQGRSAFEQQKGRELAGAQQLFAQGPQAFGQAAREIASLEAAGKQERAEDQRKKNLLYEQFQQEQIFPTKTLQEYQSMVRGFPYQPSIYRTEQNLAPSPGIGQQVIGGLGSMAAGAGALGWRPFGAKSGGQIQGGLQGLIQRHQNNMPSGLFTMPSFEDTGISSYLQGLPQGVKDPNLEIEGTIFNIIDSRGVSRVVGIEEIKDMQRQGQQPTILGPSLKPSEVAPRRMARYKELEKDLVKRGQQADEDATANQLWALSKGLAKWGSGKSGLGLPGLLGQAPETIGELQEIAKGKKAAAQKRIERELELLGGQQQLESAAEARELAFETKGREQAAGLRSMAQENIASRKILGDITAQLGTSWLNQQEHYETKRNNLAQNKISLGDVEYKKQVLALNREEFNAKTKHQEDVHSHNKEIHAFTVSNADRTHKTAMKNHNDNLDLRTKEFNRLSKRDESDTERQNAEFELKKVQDARQATLSDHNIKMAENNYKLDKSRHDATIDQSASNLALRERELNHKIASGLKGDDLEREKLDLVKARDKFNEQMQTEELALANSTHMLKVRVAESKMGVDFTLPTGTDANIMSLVKDFAKAHPSKTGGASQLYQKISTNILKEFEMISKELKGLSQADAEVKKKQIINAVVTKFTDPTAAQRGISLNTGRKSGDNKMKDALLPYSEPPGGTF